VYKITFLLKKLRKERNFKAKAGVFYDILKNRNLILLLLLYTVTDEIGKIN